MLDVKKWMAKVTNSLKGMQMALYGTYTDTLLNATASNPWTAPTSGIMVIQMTSGANNGYWYVLDITAYVGVARLAKIGTPSWWVSTSFPVIKGHQYRCEKSNISNHTAHLYAIVGGVAHRLLKALQSLSYRKAVVVC